MSRCRASKVILGWIFVLVATAGAQYQWTSMDGPRWVNGIDVAYGDGGQGLAWHRYLIGSNGSDIRPFYWGQGAAMWTSWSNPNPLPAANKLISYKIDGLGHIAFCSVYSDKIYETSNGGEQWLPVPNSVYIPNKHFTSIEVPNASDNAGNVVMVAAEAQQGAVSTYYTQDGGTNWHPIGANSTVGWQVNDIEAMMAPVYPPYMAIGTSDGIWRNMTTTWDDPWEPAAFRGLNVPVLESVRTGHGHFMVAAVEELPDDRCKLYFNDSYPPWIAPDEIKILPNGDSFNRRVKDLTAVDWGETHYSCYAATDEGVFLLTFSDPSLTTIQNLNYLPLAYDTDVQALDYYFLDLNEVDDTLYTLVATRYNVYLIKEARNSGHEISHLSVTEIVNGTYVSNVVSVSLPICEPGNEEIFSLSDMGIIKKSQNLGDATLAGLAFESSQSGFAGTDIATDFSGETDYVLASSKQDNISGATMRSQDGGKSWYDNTPGDDAVMNALAQDPNSEYAYAAGTDDYIWRRTDANPNWLASTTVFDNPNFRDIIPGPDELQDDHVYACGSGNVKVVMSTNHGDNWSPFENGLESVSDVNQLAKGWNVNWLYAATNLGVYKIDIGAAEPTWMPRTYGIWTPNLGSIVVHKNDPYAFLVATAPEVGTPHIWASGDSGRSWIELPLGDIPSQNCHIYRLAASEDANGGFVVGTDLGVFYIGDIFKRGDITGLPGHRTETWGPGVIIANGDVTVREDVELTISSPCTVYFTYNFDATNAGIDHNRVELYLLTHAHLKALGSSSERIVFTSSKPTGKAAGDWYGITPYIATVVDLEYCDIQYAVKGIEDVNFQWSMARLDVSHCTFSNMQMAGIDLYQSVSSDEVRIESSIFTSCGNYGIRVRHDEGTNLKSLLFQDNKISDCGYGIWYSGNAAAVDSKKLKLYDNIISRAAATGYYGILVQRSSSQGLFPLVELLSDSVTYFAQGGIYLSNVSFSSILMENKVKRNSNYGLRLVNSSPTIGSSSQQDYNAFCFNKYGISCDPYSNPKVRGTKIKENTGGGVQIEARSGPAAPNFGIGPDIGNNSINTQVPIPPGYYDMRNYSPMVVVMAEGNWWGGLTDFGPIIGLVDYTPSLPSDPLLGNEKRDNGLAALPSAIALDQNHPNPFNPSTNISFTLKEPGFTSLKIYSITGQLVKNVTSGQFSEGEHSVIWDGKDSQGQDVSSGIYFYVLSTENGRASKSMTLLR